MEGTCAACGKDVLFVREAKYDGFNRVGDVLRCTACGHEMDAEAAEPGPGPKALEIFTDEDRSPEIKIEGQDDQVPICRHCEHYIVNPFTQRCGLHLKEVAATDTCEDFTRGEEADE